MKLSSNRPKKIRNILIPVLSVIMDFLLEAIIMVIFSYDPVAGYQAMLETAFQGKRSIGEISVTTAPLISTALRFLVVNSAGFFNIGLSGQALYGWVTSTQVALSMSDVPWMITLPVAIIVSAVAGALAAAVPGFLHVYFGTSEVIVTIMLNCILLHTGNHIVNNVMKPSIMANRGITKMTDANASLRSPFLTGISDGSRLNIGIFLVSISPTLVWFLMRKATPGFEIRSVRLNPFTSKYAGIGSKRTIILSTVTSGVLAGLGGTVQGLGTFQNLFIQNISLSIGFDGMAVSLLGAGSSIGILLSALLFGILKLGGQGMPLIAGVPTELVDIVIAAIIFFVRIDYLARFSLTKASGSKREVAIVETVEMAPDKNNQEGRDT